MNPNESSHVDFPYWESLTGCRNELLLGTRKGTWGKPLEAYRLGRWIIYSVVFHHFGEVLHTWKTEDQRLYHHDLEQTPYIYQVDAIQMPPVVHRVKDDTVEFKERLARGETCLSRYGVLYIQATMEVGDIFEVPARGNWIQWKPYTFNVSFFSKKANRCLPRLTLSEYQGSRLMSEEEKDHAAG